MAARDVAPCKTSLDSGLTLLAEPMADRRSVSVGVWVRTGSRDEPRPLMGVTHFLEHMLFKGTTRRSALEIAHSLESRGGHLDAFTTREYVCYYARCLEEHADLALDVLADLVGHSLLADEELEREKSVVREEIQSYEDNPEEKVQDIFAQTLWGSDPLGWPILGTLETLEGLSGPAVRHFYRERYHAGALIVSAAGHLEPARLADRVATFFDVPAGDARARDDVPASTPPSVLYVPRDITQIHLVLGRSGVPQQDPRRYPLAVMSAIVGGGMSSRLFQSVRESAGLAYSVYSSLEYYRDTGIFSVSLGVRPERAAEALERVTEELERFVREGPTADELDSGRSQLKGSLILGQESVTNHMTHLAMDEMYFGRYVPVDEHLDRVQQVSRDAVMEVAREFLRPEAFTLVALGPDEQADAVRRAWPPGARPSPARP